jgi:hypothetical protein
MSGDSNWNEISEVEDQIWELIDRTGILEEEGWQQSGWILTKKDGWETLILPDGTEMSRKL